MKDTPFKKFHKEHGARFVDFAGWNMPVQYQSIVEEHRHVRSKCGLFDITHMGRINIGGPEHVQFTDYVTTNKRQGLRSGRIRYNLVCNEAGNILDDVLVYASKETTLVVCNASNRDKIWTWFNDKARGFDIELHDNTDTTAMVALQGPDSSKVLKSLVHFDLEELKYYNFVQGFLGNGPVPVTISRTGYTGEDGFELIFYQETAEYVFEQLINSGQEFDLKLIGLGARDSLRLEAGMPLYGHEISDKINPFEANLGWAVNFYKNFIGKKNLKKIEERGCNRTLVGLLVEGKRIAREGTQILYGDKPIGVVASGTKSPTFNRVIATALIPVKIKEQTDEVQIELKSGKLVTATIVPLPFYKREKICV